MASDRDKSGGVGALGFGVGAPVVVVYSEYSAGRGIGGITWLASSCLGGLKSDCICGNGVAIVSSSSSSSSLRQIKSWWASRKRVSASGLRAWVAKKSR